MVLLSLCLEDKTKSPLAASPPPLERHLPLSYIWATHRLWFTAALALRNISRDPLPKIRNYAHTKDPTCEVVCDCHQSQAETHSRKSPCFLKEQGFKDAKGEAVEGDEGAAAVVEEGVQVEGEGMAAVGEEEVAVIVGEGLAAAAVGEDGEADLMVGGVDKETVVEEA